MIDRLEKWIDEAIAECEKENALGNKNGWHDYAVLQSQRKTVFLEVKTEIWALTGKITE